MERSTMFASVFGVAPGQVWSGPGVPPLALHHAWIRNKNGPASSHRDGGFHAFGTLVPQKNFPPASRHWASAASGIAARTIPRTPRLSAERSFMGVCPALSNMAKPAQCLAVIFRVLLSRAAREDFIPPPLHLLVGACRSSTDCLLPRDELRRTFRPECVRKLTQPDKR